MDFLKKQNSQNVNSKNNSNESIINLLIELPFIKILPIYVIQDICHLISTKKSKRMNRLNSR